MPAYIVSLKGDADPEKLESAKNKVKQEGGTIKHEYTLIKAFSVEYPEGHVGVLESDEHLNVEKDGEVRTQ